MLTRSQAFAKLLLLTHYHALTIILFVALAGCQNKGNKEQDAMHTQNKEAVADTAQQVRRRPNPTFYIVPPELKDQRVWICDESHLDIFHIKNDCDYLRGCKGTFRNLSIIRAIEEYGRYNCENCSADLAHIFDENVVRSSKIN